MNLAAITHGHQAQLAAWDLASRAQTLLRNVSRTAPIQIILFHHIYIYIHMKRTIKVQLHQLKRFVLECFTRAVWNVLDWWQCAAVMRRETVTVMPSYCGGG